MTTLQEAFDADLARLNAAINAAGAVIDLDGGYQGIDPNRLPAGLLDTYSRLLQFGYANGLIP